MSFVSDASSKASGDKNKGSLSKEQQFIELTDGWYSIKTVVDVPLEKFVSEGSDVDTTTVIISIFVLAGSVLLIKSYLSAKHKVLFASGYRFEPLLKEDPKLVFLLNV